jgi:hypothetical protein
VRKAYARTALIAVNVAPDSVDMLELPQHINNVTGLLIRVLLLMFDKKPLQGPGCHV